MYTNAPRPTTTNTAAAATTLRHSSLSGVVSSEGRTTITPEPMKHGTPPSRRCGLLAWTALGVARGDIPRGPQRFKLAQPWDARTGGFVLEFTTIRANGIVEPKQLDLGGIERVTCFRPMFQARAVFFDQDGKHQRVAVRLRFFQVGCSFDLILEHSSRACRMELTCRRAR